MMVKLFATQPPQEGHGRGKHSSRAGVRQPEHLNHRTLDSKAALLTAFFLLLFLTFTVREGPEEMGPMSKGCSTSSALCSPQLRLRPAFSRLFPDQVRLLCCTFLSD